MHQLEHSPGTEWKRLIDLALADVRRACSLELAAFERRLQSIVDAVIRYAFLQAMGHVVAVMGAFISVAALSMALAKAIGAPAEAGLAAFGALLALSSFLILLYNKKRL